MASKEGGDFERAVARAFRLLSLKARQRKGTQGEADVLVFAERCERPFGVVVECTAKTGAGRVGQEKVGQVRSYATQYVTHFADVSRQFLCLVGRPGFSREAMRASRSGGEKGDRGVCLLASDGLAQLVMANEMLPVSQDDLHSIFASEGEASGAVEALLKRRNQLLAAYAAVLAVIEHDTSHADRGFVRLDRTRLMGQVGMLLHIRGTGEVADEIIERAILDLSSPLIDLIRVNSKTVHRTSSDIPARLRTLGEAGEGILKLFRDDIQFLERAK